MNLQLNFKHALVCGASKGLGKAAAIELAKIGAKVTVVARSEEKLKAVVKELNELSGVNHDYLVIDLLDTELVKKKITELNKINPIQIVINNSGGPPGGSLLSAEVEDMNQAFRNHVLCNQTIAKIVIPNMKEAKYGRIINIISTSVRQPINGIGISNTIRGAMASWAKTLSNELAIYGVTVNNVLPGTTKTERLDELINSRMKLRELSEDEARKSFLEEIPMNRFAEKIEIASAIAFLASPAASYITGVSLPVDGGKIRSI